MPRKNRLEERLNELLDLSQKESISIRMLIHFLEGRGQAALLILISLPFCLPIQIPGLSLPFGILLAFIGLRIAFGHRVWIPNAILERKITHKTLKRIVHYTTKLIQKLRGFSYTRWSWLVQTPSLHILHGLTIAVLALLLAIPLPIPFTNMACAIPIVIFGIALLDDDGILIIVAYVLTLLTLTAFSLLFWLGKGGLEHVLGSLFG